MTHEGRMMRGEQNVKAGLLDNGDTKYYLANKKDEPEASEGELEVPEKTPKKKKRGVEDGDN